MRRRVTDVLIGVGLIGVYVLAARIGLSFDAAAGFASLVWPPTGISLAALLLLGTRFWPSIFIGAVIANVLTGAPMIVALSIGVGNTGEAVVGALLLRRASDFGMTLETVRSVVSLVLFGALLSTLISATTGTASLYLGHIITSEKFGKVWGTWWIGDMVADLVWAPLVLVWARKPRVAFIH